MIWKPRSVPEPRSSREEAYSDEDSTVAEAVPDTIEEGFPRTVTQSEGFEATHEDTVRDDQPDEDGELRLLTS